MCKLHEAVSRTAEVNFNLDKLKGEWELAEANTVQDTKVSMMTSRSLVKVELSIKSFQKCILINPKGYSNEY